MTMVDAVKILVSNRDCESIYDPLGRRFIVNDEGFLEGHLTRLKPNQVISDDWGVVLRIRDIEVFGQINV